MKNARVEIRSFEASDLEHLQSLRALAFEPVFRSFREIVGVEIADVALASAEEEQAELLEKLVDPDSPDQVFVTETEGKIVGFVSMSLDHRNSTGEIGLNAVHPDHRDQGVGTRLYEFVLQQMREAGMAAATVGVGGDPSHAPARRAYEKAGFGPTIPNLWMYRSL
jgi:ribosomal protein S18 acetylase RimI-like enzyme